MVTHLCEQSKLNAASKGNFVLHVTPEEFCAFPAIVLISGYTSLSRHRMYWQQETNVFNCPVIDLLPRNLFEEILIHAKLTAGDRLAKVRPLFNLRNQPFLNVFQFDK